MTYTFSVIIFMEVIEIKTVTVFGYHSDLIELFSLGSLFSHYRPSDILYTIYCSFSHLEILHSNTCTYLKILIQARILKSITWSEMGQQTTNAKTVYCQYWYKFYDYISSFPTWF